MAHRSEMSAGYEGARLAIVIEIIPPYRIPVFNLLGKCLGDNLLVLFMSAQGGREWVVPASRLCFPYKVMNGVRLTGRSHDPFPRYWNPEVVRLLTDFSPTLIIIAGYHHPTSYAVWWYAKRRRSKLYLLCESTPFDKRSRRGWVEGLKWAFIRICDGYIVPGKASAAYLKSYGVDERLIVFAPNSIDTDSFPGYAPADDELLERERQRFMQEFSLPPFNLLFVGRLAPGKGADVAINVVKRLQNDGMEVGLILVGDGPLRGQLEARVQREGVRHTAFLGFKQPGEMAFCYRMGHLLIHPAESEPWGLVVNEAMTCGVPVLCSPKVGAAQDLVIEDRTGYQCQSVMEYVTRVAELMNNPPKLAEMRKRCREVAATFSPEACAEGFLRAFRRASGIGELS